MDEYAFKSGIVIFNYQRSFLKILGKLLKTITVIDIKSLLYTSWEYIWLDKVVESLFKFNYICLL